MLKPISGCIDTVCRKETANAVAAVKRNTRSVVGLETTNSALSSLRTFHSGKVISDTQSKRRYRMTEDLKQWLHKPKVHKTSLSVSEDVWALIERDARDCHMDKGEVINAILRKHYKDHFKKVEAEMERTDPLFKELKEAIASIPEEGGVNES
jgi:hypothetical protein